MPDEIESLDEPTPEAAKLRRFDLRGLWRVTFWGCSAALAVVVVAGTAFSDLGTERVKEAIASVIEQARPTVAQVQQPAADVQRTAELEKQAQQLEQQLKQQEQQTQQVRETLKQFAAERDQLKSRIALLEQGFEDITGAIKRQTEKAAQKAAQQAPAPAPATPPPTVSAPQTVTVAVAEPPKASSSEPVPTPQARTAALQPLPGVTQPTDAKREFGVDLGGAATLEQVRTAWSTIKANLGPELVGMRPTYAQRMKASGTVEYRLVLVGAVTDNTQAIAFCGKLSTMKLTCRAGHFRVSQLAEP